MIFIFILNSHPTDSHNAQPLTRPTPSFTLKAEPLTLRFNLIIARPCNRHQPVQSLLSFSPATQPKTLTHSNPTTSHLPEPQPFCNPLALPLSFRPPVFYFSQHLTKRTHKSRMFLFYIEPAPVFFLSLYIQPTNHYKQIDNAFTLLIVYNYNLKSGMILFFKLTHNQK